MATATNQTSVSFCPAKHNANPFKFAPSTVDSTADSLFRWSAPEQHKKSNGIIQTSFNGPMDHRILPKKNGFVNTVIQCYNEHKALVIRPDDVWMAILTQFNFFVNCNAEAMRSVFVSHQGQKDLVVVWDGVGPVDFGFMSRQMSELMEESITDKEVRNWIIPDFSTTTTNDKTVASIVMMATMKAYFTYTFNLRCGIPRVTLMGAQEDWKKILDRLEKLKEYGTQTIAWYHLLHPIISMFVSSYENPDAQENLDFWQKVAHHSGGGSGPTFLSGWITAFCVFNEKGQWVGQSFKKTPSPDISAKDASASEFFASYVAPVKTYLTIDGAHYPQIDTKKIPCGFAEVDVTLIDASGKEFKTCMVAGSVALQITSSNDTGLSTTGKDDVAHPVLGWWYFHLADEKQSDATK